MENELENLDQPYNHAVSSANLFENSSTSELLYLKFKNALDVKVPSAQSLRILDEYNFCSFTYNAKKSIVHNFSNPPPPICTLTFPSFLLYYVICEQFLLNYTINFNHHLTFKN